MKPLLILTAVAGAITVLVMFGPLLGNGAGDFGLLMVGWILVAPVTGFATIALGTASSIKWIMMAGTSPRARAITVGVWAVAFAGSLVLLLSTSASANPILLLRGAGIALTVLTGLALIATAFASIGAMRQRA